MKSISYKQLPTWYNAFKRMAWPHLFFVLFLMFWHLSVSSQSISFTQIAPPKEVPFTFQITGIAQDTLGYMWFTSGPILYRYNGYEIITYMNDRLNPNSLAGERLECVMQIKTVLSG